MEARQALPKVFIGSSVEGLDIAYAVQEELEYTAEPTVWSQGIFQPSRSTLDDLIRVLDTYDFGVFVFSPDDVLRIRDQQVLSVRDNVIFELGLFIGRLGKERSFFILPRNQDQLHLPTDLLGITSLTFNADRRERRPALGPACNTIREIIRQRRFRQHLATSSLGGPLGTKEQWINLGDLHYEQGFYEGALEAYKKAILLDPSNALIINKKANALKKLGRYEEALTTYEQAIGLAPNLAVAYRGKSAVLAALGRYEEALTVCGQAINLDPRSAENHSKKGEILNELRRFEDALAACEQAIHLNSNLAEAYYNKGYALKGLDRPRESDQALIKAAQLDHRNAS